MGLNCLNAIGKKWLLYDPKSSKSPPVFLCHHSIKFSKFHIQLFYYYYMDSKVYTERGINMFASLDKIRTRNAANTYLILN